MSGTLIHRFSTIHFYIILKPSRLGLRVSCVSVPYVFTSFSNFPSFYIVVEQFQYHTFLHHSQTTWELYVQKREFQYHTFLHHSQTCSGNKFWHILFQYHTFLHHSQTSKAMAFSVNSFQYHTFLHHSQTSNSKMNRHHLRKTRYSNTFNRFHIDLYL